MDRSSGMLALLVFVAACSDQATTPLWRTLPDIPPMPVARESGMAPVNGVQIHYAIYGEGPALILLHGGLSNGEHWSPQIAAFSAKHEVIVLDSRGHGRSTRDERPFSYDLMADDVIAAMDHLKVEKASIVGWSDGGIIGIALAMKHPERLIKLWAFGANTDVGGLDPDAEKNETFVAYIARAGEDYARISPTPKQYDAFVAQISQMWKTQPDFGAADLARITTPTMIADGEYDEAIRREHTERMAREIPGAKLFIMPGVSHFAHWQAPAAYNEAVLAFIDD